MKKITPEISLIHHNGIRKRVKRIIPEISLIYHDDMGDEKGELMREIGRLEEGLPMSYSGGGFEGLE